VDAFDVILLLDHPLDSICYLVFTLRRYLCVRYLIEGSRSKNVDTRIDIMANIRTGLFDYLSDAVAFSRDDSIALNVFFHGQKERHVA